MSTVTPFYAILTLSDLSEKNKLCGISSNSFSALVKNAVLFPQRVVLPIHKGTTARCRLKWLLASLFNLLGRLWEPAANCKGCLVHFKCAKGHYNQKRAAKPNQIIHYAMHKIPN
jgi:hypothetical protein